MALCEAYLWAAGYEQHGAKFGAYPTYQTDLWRSGYQAARVDAVALIWRRLG